MARGYSNAGGGIAVDSILDLQSTNPVQNAIVTAALNNKADTYDLGTLQDTVQSLGETIDQVNENLSNEIAGKQDTLNEEQMNAVNSGITSTILNEKTQELAIASQDILAIQGKIPAQASSSNQLADKDFVNSSISTNTANFIGTFNSIEELEAYSGSITNNDYAFVIDDDGSGTTIYNRYKYNGTGWIFEYSLNNSSFTAAQWEAINSGATTSAINSIAGKANLADLATVATSGSYNDLIDKPAEKEIPTINNEDFTVLSNKWVSNTDSATSAAFPYKQPLDAITVNQTFDATDTGYNVSVSFDPASAVSGKLAGFCTFIAVAGTTAGTTDVTVTIYSNDNTIAPTGYVTVMHS